MDKQITFETAKLAAEKGITKAFFQRDMLSSDMSHMYHPDGMYGAYNDYHECFRVYDPKNPNQTVIPMKYSELTQSMTQTRLQTILRNYYDINVAVSFKPNTKKWDFITYSMSLNGKEYTEYYYQYYTTRKGREYDSYEDALEEALKEGISLSKDCNLFKPFTYNIEN